MSVPNGLSCTRYVQVEVGRFRPAASRLTPSAVTGAPRKVSADRAAASSSSVLKARIASLLNSFSGTVPRARARSWMPSRRSARKARCSAQARSRWNRTIWRAAPARTARSIPWLSSASRSGHRRVSADRASSPRSTWSRCCKTMRRWSSTSLLYCQVLRWISRLTPSATRCAWPSTWCAFASGSPVPASPGAYWRISSSSMLAKKTDPPGSPCRPARPRSCWSSRLLACRPVPITYRPPSSAIRSRSPPVPPRRMSVPRPAIWVDTVIAPWAPASATMAASWASFLALSTAQRSPARPSSPASRSDSATSSVPIRTGRPVACAAATSPTTASSFSLTVAYSRSGWSARTHGRFGGITAISRP